MNEPPSPRSFLPGGRRLPSAAPPPAKIEILMDRQDPLPEEPHDYAPFEPAAPIAPGARADVDGAVARGVPPPISSIDDFLRAVAPKEAAPIQFTLDGQGPAVPPRMLIKGLVPADGICFLGGQSGAGKTFIAIHMATCLASEIDFFGRKIKERIGCVILAAEGSGGLQRRINVAKRVLEINEELPIGWRAVTEYLLDPDSLARIIEALKELSQQFRDEHGVRLGAVFVDTIGAAFGLEDENDAAKVNAAMRVLRQIGDAIDAVIIPVHHYGKAASTGLRGSSAFRGAADAVLSVLAERDELTGKSDNRSLCLAVDGGQNPRINGAGVKTGTKYAVGSTVANKG